MKLSDFGILTDENINPLLITLLKEQALDIVHVYDVGLEHTTDEEILAWSFRNQRIILTLDDDFGTLIFKGKQPFIGIIRLHPGHLVGDVHIPTLKAILTADIDFQIPFLLTAEKRSDHVHIRYRSYTE